MSGVAAKQEIARRLVRGFEKDAGKPLLRLASHAALPVALTPDLVHLLRINFPDDAVDYFDESRLLLSALCTEIQDGFYVIDHHVRDILLKNLQDEEGGKRFRDIAILLYEYSKHRAPWGDLPRLEKAQEIAVRRILDPSSVARDLTELEGAGAGGYDDEWHAAMLLEMKLPNPPIDGPSICCLAEDSSTSSAIREFGMKYVGKKGVAICVDTRPLAEVSLRGLEELAKKSRHYGLMCLYNFSLSVFSQNRFVHTIRDLEEQLPKSNLPRHIAKDFFPEVWKEVGHFRDPKTPDAEMEPIGYPFAANSMILACNRRLFEDRDNQADYKARYHEDLVVPTDWTSFKQIAEFFTRSDGSLHGVALQGKCPGFPYLEWCNFAYGMGGGVMQKTYGWEGDDSTPLLIDSEQTAEATDYYVSLKPYAAEGFREIASQEQVKLLKTERAAMGIMFSDFAYCLIEESEGSFEFAPIPGTKSMLGGGVFYFNKWVDGQGTERALEFVTDYLQPENQVVMASRGLCSPLRSIYDAPEVKRLPYAEALVQSLERGVYMLEAGPEAKAVEEIVSETILAIWDGKESVRSGLRNARKKIELAQKDYHYLDGS